MSIISYYPVEIILLLLLLLISLYFAGALLYAVLTRYKPPEIEALKPVVVCNENIPTNLKILSWNLGYGGLGKDADFFYDGGKSLRVSQEITTTYHKGIEDFLKNQNADIYLFQEIDTLSRRSYYLNQLSRVSNVLASYNFVFAKNYHVNYIPIPVFKPMGKVRSGMAVFSKYIPLKSLRYALPGSFKWPVSLFFLKRCLLIQHYKVDNEKTLILVNLHNSAYDSKGILKKQELNFLKEILLDLYDKNHYIVVGGDWNQPPPGFDATKFSGKLPDFYAAEPISSALFPKEWQWIYDERTPTNRSLEKAYVEGENSTTLLDYFLVSPNIQVREFSTIKQNFSYSDHEPVQIEISLK